MNKIYKSTYIRILILLLIFLTGNRQVFAQKFDKNLPLQIYERANQLYKRGLIDESLSKLKPLLQKKFLLQKLDKSQQADIYLLAAKGYLLMKKPDMASIYVKEMLANNPNIKIEGVSGENLIWVNSKLNSLYTMPRLSVGINIGANLTDIKSDSIFNSIKLKNNINTNYKFKSLTGFQLKAILEWTLNKRFSIFFNPGFILQKYGYERDKGVLNAYSYEQKLSYIDIPAGIRFYFLPSKQIKPYLEASGYSKFLVAAKRNTGTNSAEVLELMRKFDIGITGGGGINYYRKKMCYGINLRYTYGFINIDNNNNRYITGGSSDSFLYQHYDVMDEIKIQNIQLSFSIAYYLSHKVFEKN